MRQKPGFQSRWHCLSAFGRLAQGCYWQLGAFVTKIRGGAVPGRRAGAFLGGQIGWEGGMDLVVGMRDDDGGGASAGGR